MVLVFSILLSSISIESKAASDDGFIDVTVNFPLVREMDFQCGNVGEYTTQLEVSGQKAFRLPSDGSYIITRVVQIGSGFSYDWSEFDCGTNLYISSGGLATFEYKEGAFDYNSEALYLKATQVYDFSIVPDVYGYYNNVKLYGIRGYVNRLQYGNFRVYYKQVENFTEGQKLDNIDGTLQEQHETQKGIFSKITEFFGSFFQNLIDSVIHLFVPTAEEMGEIFDRLNTFFEEKFGFLYYPFDILIRLFDVCTSNAGTTLITFPGFSIMGYQIWEDIEVDLLNSISMNVFSYVRIATGILCLFWFINYLRDYFDKRFGGGGQ